ncbi:MAG: ubiquitin-like protein Pup [Microthrixaceae bacterium]
MPERETRKRVAPSRTETDQDVDEANDTVHSGTGDKLKAEMDDLLDEIDEVLETNAEEFVKAYVQKGGQ